VDRGGYRQAAGPQAADLSVVVGAVDAGVMMQAMMLWLLLHYQRILGHSERAWHLLRQEMDVLMKLVTAIIRPFKLDEVRDALIKIGVQGLTVTEVQGYGRQKGHTEIYRGAEYAERLLPKIKVEIACLSNQVDEIIKTITSSAASITAMHESGFDPKRTGNLYAEEPTDRSGFGHAQAPFPMQA
jgi:nitrogen regulatory protein PII